MKNKEHTQTSTWAEIENHLADESGFSVIVVKGESSITVSETNNNSLCRVLSASEKFSPRCAEFCGRAVKDSNEEGKTIYRQCYAGLHYAATPIDDLGEGENLAVISGRAFIKTDDYRNATERAISGDWQQFPAEELFGNILLAGSLKEIESLGKRLEGLSEEDRVLLLTAGKTQDSNEKVQIAGSDAPDILQKPAELDEMSRRIEELLKRQAEEISSQYAEDRRMYERRAEEIEELATWRSLFSSILDRDYKEASKSVLQFLSQKYSLDNLAWLEHKNGYLETVLASGDFTGQQIQVSIKADDERLLEVVKKETSLELKERKSAHSGETAGRIISLFPIAVGGEVRSALIVGDSLTSKAIKHKIAKFAQSVASELEILRLRDEIERQAWLTKTVHRLNELFKKIDTEDFWGMLAQIMTELMKAERGSLLVFDEAKKELVVKAAVGNRADMVKRGNNSRVGERIAQNVLNSGRPLVVKDLMESGMLPAPMEWQYKTKSFISYPIVIGRRKIGVLNVADKVDGTAYNELDLELLNTIAPQVAMALDHTSLKRKAGEFEQLSITDPLTGLVNRRYLEERMSEEISRSQRHGYPMSFMMIDVDEFKSYNDSYSHPEGDKALQLVGQCLKATLRGADVAARYGGEEFSILLPQTTLAEARTIAERIRERVEDTRFPNRQVTVSIGVAFCTADTCDPSQLIAAADKALYEAKSLGKNNVQIFKRESAGETLGK